MLTFTGPPDTKDEPGWAGPYLVVRNEPDDGQVIVRVRGRDVPYRYQNV